jgi:hypothetical protein
MSKPLGIDMILDPTGTPMYNVKKISRIEDAIWNAVEEAQLANWTPQQFIRETRQAWHELRIKAAKEEDEKFK